MYYSIMGRVAHKTESYAAICTGGICYQIFASVNTLASCNLNEEIELLTYLQVKEDALVLFGFLTCQERDMFLHLISISGIGCKMAISILSGVSAFDLAMAIVTADTKALSGIKGIGKKTAERIVLELKEKISESDIALSAGTSLKTSGVMGDAILALQALGWSRAEAVNILSNVENAESLNLNQLVAAALKHAGKNRR